MLKDSPLDALNQGKRREESVHLLLKKSIAQVDKGAREAPTLASFDINNALLPFYINRSALISNRLERFGNGKYSLCGWGWNGSQKCLTRQAVQDSVGKKASHPAY